MCLVPTAANEEECREVCRKDRECVDSERKPLRVESRPSTELTADLASEFTECTERLELPLVVIRDSEDCLDRGVGLGLGLGLEQL